MAEEEEVATMAEDLATTNVELPSQVSMEEVVVAVEEVIATTDQVDWWLFWRSLFFGEFQNVDNHVA